MVRHRAMLSVALAVLSCCVPPWCRAIKLGADPFGKCPAQIVLESGEQEQRAWFGLYNRSHAAPEPVFNGGRPIYAGPRNYYLYFVEKKGNWMVGLDHSKDIADGYSHSDVQCPQDATNWRHLYPKTREWVLSRTRLSSFNESAPLAAPPTMGAPRGFPGAPSGGFPAASSSGGVPAASQAASQVRRGTEKAAGHSVNASPAVASAAPAAASPADPPVVRESVEAPPLAASPEASLVARPGEPLQAKRYAIAMYGGITGVRGKFGEENSHRGVASGSQTSMKSTVNLTIPAILLKENLLGPADVFIHSWSPSYETTLKHLYNPQIAHYEVNELDMPEIRRMAESLPHGHWSGGYYPQIGHVSMVRSLSKVLKIIDDYQEDTGHVYDSVFLCRPDVLVRTKIDLNMFATGRIEWPDKKTASIAKPKENDVFYTSGISGRADFHYLMSGRSVKAFSTVYDSLPNLTKPIMAHSGWIQEFLLKNKLRAAPSDTIASTDEEVYRKVPNTPEWRAVLEPLLPTKCMEQLMSHSGISDECLVDM